MITIDKNVPAPAGKNLKYPWAEMEVGDSFAIPNAVTQEQAAKVRGACAAFAHRTGTKFSIRKDEAGVLRCWRLA